MTGLTPSDPWPYSPGLLGPELERYLADATPPEVQQRQTRCPPWTVRKVTVHLVCTFPRCCKTLGRGRAGYFMIARWISANEPPPDAAAWSSARFTHQGGRSAPTAGPEMLSQDAAGDAVLRCASLATGSGRPR